MDGQRIIVKEETDALSQATRAKQSLDILVTAAQQGDLEAFGEIVQRFRSMAYTAAYTLLEDAHLAEDVMQEAFIEAYLNLSKLREPAAFPGWFKRILFKQGDRLTRGKQLPTIPLEPDSTFDIAHDELNPAVVVENDETQYLVQQAIYSLPTHERIVAVLFYANGYPLKDISTFLEVPVSTLKKRLFDARKHLKARLQREVRERHYNSEYGDEKHFPAHIQLLIAVRIGDIKLVTTMLDHAPFLINDHLGWHAQNIYPVTQKTHLSALPGHSSALVEAVKYKHPELVTLLLDYGANCNIRDSNGLTPLQKAVIDKQTDMVTLLLARGAYVDMLSAANLAALHLSAIGGSCEIAMRLLQQHAKINIRGQGGRTPLHWAALRGQRAMLSLLLQHGADHTMRDELQRTPLDWAKERGHRELLTLLQL